MPLIEPLYKISEICSAFGIEDVVICPGSRSAAMTLAFSRNPKIKTKVIADERSAAFVALGMAQQAGKTVALVCTSGSAALNFAPAISEAFFQEIPLLILTADRPPEWIHQYDGQTIFQKDLYGKHVKKAYDLPVDTSHKDAQWQVERIVNEAINLTKQAPVGPVHINLPIREPFFPLENEFFFGDYRKVNFIPIDKKINTEAWFDLINIWERSERKMIAVGQNFYNLDAALKGLSEEEGVVVLADVISNVNIEDKISFHDVFLSKKTDLETDLLITTGKSFISKAFKQLVRNNKPDFHWHIQENPDLIDPLQSITHKIDVSPAYFFKELFETLDFRKIGSGDNDGENDFKLDWFANQEVSKRYVYKFLNTVDFGEMKATAMLFESIENDKILHLGNSMPVRYANLLGGICKSRIQVYANRGTSGIDGIVSTAIGQALKTDQMVLCLVGDVSFFYDSNALFVENLPKNFRIVVINNAGGNIFRMIDGPSKQQELESHFVTKQNRTAKSLCLEAGVRYFKASDIVEMAESLKILLMDNAQAALLEVFTDGEADANIFKELKNDFTL
jgi:2-succinyl-5-enolpyruvyl-6-hydroxy-3-cyclohexene-1-carboxylate synthase